MQLGGGRNIQKTENSSERGPGPSGGQGFGECVSANLSSLVFESIFFSCH